VLPNVQRLPHPHGGQQLANTCWLLISEIYPVKIHGRAMSVLAGGTSSIAQAVDAALQG
jgi:hypothetical protein